MNVFLGASRCGSANALHLGFLGVTAGLVVLVWLGIVSIRMKIADVEFNASECTSLLEQEKAIHQSCRESNQCIASLEQTIQSFRDLLPESADETLFLQQLSINAADLGVSLGDFRPGSVIEREHSKEMELRLRGTGTYASLARWLHSFREIPRVLRISELSISAPAMPGGDCSFDIRIDLLFGLKKKSVATGIVKT